jgi:sugar/nucleoside kinase (ribokinase family)
MASYNVVEDNLEFFKEMVASYVDILFANEEEAKAFTAKEPEAALNEMAKLVEIAVVKTGSEGSMVKKGDQVTLIRPITANPMDTTGAGDLYAAGFLFGLINNLGFVNAGYIGSLLASTVIEKIGAKIPADKWAAIKHKINTL